MKLDIPIPVTFHMGINTLKSELFERDTSNKDVMATETSQINISSLKNKLCKLIMHIIVFSGCEG